jgi:hypothetical protein
LQDDDRVAPAPSLASWSDFFLPGGTLANVRI